MKIVFVAFGYENLAVEYLSAFLKEQGHNVYLVFDPALFNTYHLSNKLLAKVFNYRNKIINRIIELNPDIVAFSVLSDNYAWASDIAEELKKKRQDLLIVFGGIHPTSVPEEVIKEDFVDYVCAGEGEEALLDLANALEAKEGTCSIPNIWSKNNGTVFRNPPRRLIDNLDKLPLPDKELFHSEYAGFTGNIYMAMTSRGCPYICSYCYNSYLMGIYKDKGRYLRRFSVNRVIEELESAKRKFRMRRIVFVDDVFTADQKWLESFVEQYKKKINIPFGCLVHPLFVNKEIVDLLKQGGCTVAGMGIQTLNERIKKQVVRRLETNSDVEDAIFLFKKAGILIYVDFIFGLPGESRKDAEDAALFLSRNRPDAVSTLWLRYYPRAEIINIAREKKLLSEEQIRDINKGAASAPASDFGNTKSDIDRRLVTLILISCNLPVWLVKFLLQHKVYRFLPGRNIHHLHTVSKQIFNKLLHQRDGSLYSSISVQVKYYANYTLRLMKYANIIN